MDELIPVNERKGKIKYYGLEEYVLDQLFWDRLSSRKIRELLILEKGIALNHTTIEAFKKDMIKHARKYFEEDDEYRKKVAEMQVNTMEMIYDLAMDIKEKIDEYRDYEEPIFDKEGNQIGSKKDWMAHVSYLDKNLKLLFILLKKNKEIGPDIQVNKTMNVMNITNAFKDRVVEVVDYAILHGGSIEMFPPEVQEMYKKSKGMYAYA